MSQVEIVIVVLCSRNQSRRSPRWHCTGRLLLGGWYCIIFYYFCSSRVTSHFYHFLVIEILESWSATDYCKKYLNHHTYSSWCFPCAIVAVLWPYWPPLSLAVFLWGVLPVTMCFQMSWTIISFWHFWTIISSFVVLVF